MIIIKKYNQVMLSLLKLVMKQLNKDIGLCLVFIDYCAKKAITNYEIPSEN